MRPYEIFLMDRVETRRTLISHDEFTFTKKVGWVPLQRLCFWFLRKIKAYAIREITMSHRIRIDPDTFVDRLFKQREYIARELGRGGAEILIGAEDYEELMGDRDIYTMFSFDARYGRGTTIRGMKVTVVPWIKGVVVLP